MSEYTDLDRAMFAHLSWENENMYRLTFIEPLSEVNEGTITYDEEEEDQ